MTKRMNGEGFNDADLNQPLFERSLHLADREPGFTRAQKQSRRVAGLLLPPFEVLLQHPAGVYIQKFGGFMAALSSYGKALFRQIDIGYVQADQFPYTQPGIKKQVP